MKLLIVDGPPSLSVYEKLDFLHEYGFGLVSIGQIIRELLNSKTELGQQLKSCIDNGKLIFDDLILTALHPYFTVSSNLVLLGFPRTDGQLQNLLNYTHVDAYVCVELIDEVLLDMIAEETGQQMATSRLKNCLTALYRNETLEEQILNIADEHLAVN